VVRLNPEKAIVNLWLNKKGFFTVHDLNAGNRVIDLLAIKQKDGLKIQHIEISCSISPGVVTEKEKRDLLRKFNDSNVIRKVKKAIKNYTGRDADYEKVLISTNNVDLENVKVMSFGSILLDVVKDLDRQYYKNSVTRTMQLLKYLLIAKPSSMAVLFGKEDAYKPLTHAGREAFIKDVLLQDVSKRIFKKQNSEKVLIELLKESSLKQPERLAKALDKIFSKRSSTRFINTLLKQKNVQTAIKEEVAKDQNLEKFFRQ
jgi:predicted nucleic-acid-binding protein